MAGLGAVVVAASALLGASAGEPAGAAATPQPEALTFRTAGACPTAAATEAALRDALPGLTLVEVASGEAAALIEDRGARLAVSLRGQERTFEDPGRDCEERARNAALVLALALYPPHVEDPAVVDREVPPMVVVPEPVVEERPVEPVGVDISVEAALAATAASGGAASVGGGVRLGIGRGVLGAALGASAFTTATLAYSDVVVSMTRVPADLSLTATLARPRYRFFGELGPAVVPFVGGARNLAVSRQGLGVDFGVRAGLGLAFRASARVWTRIAVEAVAIPVPTWLSTDDRAPLGRTPYLWLGASVGVDLRLR